GAFGWDVPVVGAAIYQPIGYRDELRDIEVQAVTLDGGGNKVVKRPGVMVGRARIVDAFTGTDFAVGTKAPMEVPEAPPCTDLHGFCGDGECNAVLSVPAPGIHPIEFIEWCADYELCFDQFDAPTDCSFPSTWKVWHQCARDCCPEGEQPASTSV